MREILLEIFHALPREIGCKLKYENLASGRPARETARALKLLLEAGIAVEVKHSDGTAAPLGAEESDKARKLFFLDIGLLVAALEFGGVALGSALEKGLSIDGLLAEQFTAQELSSCMEGAQRPFTPHYWLRDKQKHKAEVDFLLAVEGRVLPIEVKSGKNGSLRSLKEWCALRSTPLAVKLSEAAPEVHEDAFPTLRPSAVRGAGATRGDVQTTTLLSVPLYLAGEIPRICRAWFEG